MGLRDVRALIAHFQRSQQQKPKNAQQTLHDLFMDEDEGSEFIDEVNNTFIELIDESNSAGLEALIDLLLNEGINVSEIDNRLEYSEGDLPRSMLFYAGEKNDRPSIRILKKYGFRFHFTARGTTDVTNKLISTAKHNIKSATRTRSRSRSRSRTRSRSRSRSNSSTRKKKAST